MTNEKHWMQDLLVLALTLAALYGFDLGGRALWSPIEGRYSEIAREMLTSGDYVTARVAGAKYFDKPPFFFWLETAAIRWFGLNEWSLRFWPALFALSGCLAVYAAGRSLFGRMTGLLSAVYLCSDRHLASGSRGDLPPGQEPPFSLGLFRSRVELDFIFARDE